MDTLEHVPYWEDTLDRLLSWLKPGGMLFCNNAILDDQTHPEHYPLTPQAFRAACVARGLRALNEISYVYTPEVVQGGVPVVQEVRHGQAAR